MSSSLFLAVAEPSVRFRFFPMRTIPSHLPTLHKHRTKNNTESKTKQRLNHCLQTPNIMRIYRRSHVSVVLQHDEAWSQAAHSPFQWQVHSLKRTCCTYPLRRYVTSSLISSLIIFSMSSWNLLIKSITHNILRQFYSLGWSRSLSGIRTTQLEEIRQWPRRPPYAQTEFHWCRHRVVGPRPFRRLWYGVRW